MTNARGTQRVSGTVYSLAISVFLPLIAAVLLRAPERIVPVVLLSVAINLVFRAGSASPEASRLQRRVRVALPLLLAASIAYIVVSILIIPFSIYVTWFRLVELGQHRGPVSRLFVYVIGFFAAVISGGIYRKGVVVPTLTLGSVMLVVVSMVLRSVVPLLIAVPLVVVALAARCSPVNGGARFPLLTMKAAAGLVALAVLAGALAGVSGSARGNRYIDNGLSPMLRQTVVRFFPGYPLLYGGDGYGYSFDEQSLGGTPLLSMVPILELAAQPGERIYLRTDVYDHYSGSSWLRSQGLLERLQEPSTEMMRGYGGSAPTVPLPVTILTDFYEKVPHTLTTRSVSGAATTEISAVRGHRDVGYLFDLPLGKGDEIVLQRVLEEPPLYDRNLRRSLQLPDQLPGEVRRIARQLGRDQEDPRAILRSITEYLADGFQYSLETNPTLERVDFVEDFLFDSRTGYCVHFATSFVVLARMNDIPARYVTGFLVSVPVLDDYADIGYGIEYAPDEDGRVRHRVTGYAAHAWPEVWLPDSGWVVWEATPAMRVGEYDDLAFLQAMSNPDSLTSRQLREILGRGEDAQETQITDRERPETGWYSLLMIPGLTLGGVVVIGARRRYVPIVDTRRAVDALALRLARVSRRRTIAEPGEVGWREWSHQVDRAMPGNEHVLVPATEVIQRTCFGGYTPTRVEVGLLRGLERLLKGSKRVAGRGIRQP